ncbi:hypothetical protein PGT21_012527 [Puccinia graminis f. sp. tritici]|uniref:VWFC domain-containing protein n=1 Tax=Puccinia graminis f. sp. tritici TaxID=56615 RepID=A0A5B0P6V5_PUCGR|nr:hypothetical protein PGT21_012527 [Puccinia graminis f. sp. tritici]KAA1132118.1 hypothetical protein PGTUg99_037235 [Puccinia graminis f. sp. tritici]
MRSTLAILLVSLVLCHISIAQTCSKPGKCTCTSIEPPRPAPENYCPEGCCVQPPVAQTCSKPSKCTCTSIEPPRPEPEDYCPEGCCVGPPSESQ